MKTICPIILLLLSLLTTAQVDSVRHTRTIAPYVASGTTMAGGILFSFQPQMQQLSVNLRDAIQSEPKEQLGFDNILQFAPMAAAPALNLCGLHSRHTLSRMLTIEGFGTLLGYSSLQAAKYSLRVQRPDSSGKNSFPSGHTYIAFAGAEVLRHEYGTEYPWLAIAGYAVATLVGSMRIYNNRHWIGDVLAGAGMGILSINISYWLFE